MKKYNLIYRYLIISVAFLAISLNVSAQKINAGKYKITPETLNPKPISPMIYGHFIELGFGRQIEGMWAEKLYNPSFEIVEPFKTATWGWLMRTPADDLTKEEWWHSGYEECKWFALLQNGQRIPITYSRYSGFYHGLQAANLDNRQNQTRAYLGQDSVWIKKGISNIFRGAIKINRQANRPAGGAGAPVTAAPTAVSVNTPPAPVTPITVKIGLYPGKDFAHPIVEKTITVKDAFYKEFTTELNAGSYNGRATFAVSVDPGVNASFDGFSLMPSDAVNGWRKDVITSLKKIGVPMIRWPGGCFDSFYHWRDGIGPKEDRMPVNSEYWGDIEENNVGIVEFVQLCRSLGSEPFVGVNMLTGTATEAAEWVAYTNGNSGDLMSNLRKEHGYAEPLNVKYWELDNETSRRWGYEEYAQKCIQFSKAMKAADPKIELVMVYYSFRGYLKELLDIAGQYVDLIADRSGTEIALKEDLAIIAAYNKQHGTNIRLCNTEWLAQTRSGFGAATEALNQRQVNTRMTRQQHQISWNYAMNTVYQLLIFQRLGNDFLWSNFNNLANTWGQNIIECTKDTVFISSAGRIFELMSKSKAAWVLKTDTLTNLNGVFVQATTTTGKDKIILYFLNYHPVQSQVNLDLSAFKVTSKDAVVKIVSGEGPFSANTSSDYRKIQSTEQVIKVNSVKTPLIILKPWSVTEMTLNLQ
jgi:alpha-N-arabinofuranosidase